MLYGGELGLEIHKEILKFITVGVINTMLDAVAYLFFTRVLFEAPPVAAKFFSFLVGIISPLFLNRYWTFGVRTPLRFIEVGRFYAIVSLSLGVNVGAMHVLVNAVHIHDLIALAFTTVFTFAFNFTLSKFWVFQKARAGAHSAIERMKLTTPTGNGRVRRVKPTVEPPVLSAFARGRRCGARAGGAGDDIGATWPQHSLRDRY